MLQKVRDQLKSPENNNKLQKSPSSSEANLSNNNVAEGKLSRVERVTYAIENLEHELDEKLRSQELIGSVTDRRRLDQVQIKARRVKFTWQRGIKIGLFINIIFIIIMLDLLAFLCKFQVKVDLARFTRW